MYDTVDQTTQARENCAAPNNGDLLNDTNIGVTQPRLLAAAHSLMKGGRDGIPRAEATTEKPRAVVLQTYLSA